MIDERGGLQPLCHGSNRHTFKYLPEEMASRLDNAD